MAEMDLTDLFNTKLEPAEEAAFQAWAKKVNRAGDVHDYDLRGAWKANAQEAANGHLPDTFKKPNHPTFSSESQYNGVEGMTGGQWLQTRKGWQFIPSPWNLKQYSAPELQRYFKINEPDAALVLSGAR